MHNTLQNILAEHHFQTILVGFSGGADSTALLTLLNKESEKYGITTKAIHFNHGLRGEESDDDSKWCEEFCSERHIDFQLIDLDVSNNQTKGENLEAASRRLRLEKWHELTGETSCKVAVALGHHSDDRTENLFLRLCRGANTSGLTSMRTVQQVDGVTFIRPLLESSRNDVLEFLRSEGIEAWREDHTNRDIGFKRNFFRHRIIPQLTDHIDYAARGILQSLNVLEEDADFIEKEALSEFQKIAGKSAIPTQFLFDLHPAVRVRVFRYWLSEQLEKEFIPPRSILQRLNEHLCETTSNEKKLIPCQNNIFISIVNGIVSLQEKCQKEVLPVDWLWRTTSEIHWKDKVLTAEIKNTSTECPDIVGQTDGESRVCFDSEKMPDTLIVREWYPADKMIPFGRKSEVKLKKIFMDNKISSEKKVEYPLICLPCGKIIWIPGVKRSDFAPLEENTTKAVILRISGLC